MEVKTKPKIRLVPSGVGAACTGCAMQARLLEGGKDFSCNQLALPRCVQTGGPTLYHHIKHVGEHPSTR